MPSCLPSYPPKIVHQDLRDETTRNRKPKTSWTPDRTTAEFLLQASHCLAWSRPSKGAGNAAPESQAKSARVAALHCMLHLIYQADQSTGTKRGRAALTKYLVIALLFFDSRQRTACVSSLLGLQLLDTPVPPSLRQRQPRGALPPWATAPRRNKKIHRHHAAVGSSPVG